MRPPAARGARPDNPWQRATALGRRLRVTVVADRDGDLERLTLATWQHPDLPLLYTIDARGTWSLWHDGKRVDTGPVPPATAAQYLECARTSEPRRLAAAVMLRRVGVA